MYAELGPGRHFSSSNQNSDIANFFMPDNNIFLYLYLVARANRNLDFKVLSTTS